MENLTEEVLEQKELVPEQPIKEESVLIGQSSSILTEEVKIAEMPKLEAVKIGLVKEEENLPEVSSVGEIPTPVIVPEPISKNAPMDEKIKNYIKSRGTKGDIKLNDFLKSLFPLPQFNEPPVWQLQHNSRVLRNLLEDMQNKGDIFIVENRHRQLGDHYYKSDTPVTQYHTLNSLEIIAKN